MPFLTNYNQITFKSDVSKCLEPLLLIIVFHYLLLLLNLVKIVMNWFHSMLGQHDEIIDDGNAYNKCDLWNA